MERRAWYVWGLLLLASSLRAQVILNTIGDGRYGVEVRIGRDGNKNVECAVAFKANSTFKLKSITVPLSVAMPLGAMTLELAADAGAAGPAQIRWWNTVDSWSKDSWSTTLRPEARREMGGPCSVIYSPYVLGIVVQGAPSKLIAASSR